MKLIHVFNFALVSKRFHFISRAYKYFLDKLRISKHIISFDFHYLLFLLKELLQLNKEIFGTFKDSIKTNAFVFNLVVLKLMGLLYKLLLFRIYWTPVCKRSCKILLLAVIQNQIPHDISGFSFAKLHNSNKT